VIRVKERQERVIRVAKHTLGKIKNPFELPQWLPELRNREVLRADIMAGLTVALILIPQSMAYAQLAGLPAHYGLLAATDHRRFLRVLTATVDRAGGHGFIDDRCGAGAFGDGRR
jgi:uncharacterized protein HemY